MKKKSLFNDIGEWLSSSLKARAIVGCIIFVFAGSQQLYHWINSSVQLYNPNTEHFDFQSTNPKMLFTSKFKQDANHAPTPYNIFAIDLKTKQTIRLTYGDIFDFSPSYSKHLNCVFFTGNRDSLGKEAKFQYDEGNFMKIEISTMEITSAKSVIDFLNIKNTKIINPRLSPYNDSLLAFYTKSDNPQFHICNYISQKNIVSFPIEDVYKYKFARKYLLIQQSGVPDSLRLQKINLKTGTIEPVMMVPYLHDIDMTGDFMYSICSKSCDTSKILYSKIDLETYVIDTIENNEKSNQPWLKFGNYWPFPDLILNDSVKIISDSLDKLWLYDNIKPSKIFDREGVNDDFYIWYDKK